jgi:ABC-type sugar transport system substrate-binding protein
MIKRSVMGTVVGALGLMMSFNAAEAAAEGKKVAFFISGPTHPYIAALSKSFNARAKELGMVVTQFDTPYDAALQSQQIDDAIARKFDILAIQSASQSAVIPVLNRAKNAGIPVIMINNPMKAGLEPLYVTEIADDNPKLGRLAAESVAAEIKKGGRSNAKIALITGVLAEGVAKDRLEAFNEVIKRHPDVKVVATEDAFWDTAKSETIAGQLLARFAPQGGLDAMVGWADNQALAIIRAAEAARVPMGTAKGQMIVAGTNCTPDGIKAIESGKLYSSGTQAPVSLGRQAADLVADHLNGKTLQKHVVLDVHLINKSTVGNFTAGCTY